MQHALATLAGTVLRSVRRHDMVAPGERVLVAVSGGADSVGLLAVLAALRRKLGVDLVAAHVHHGLRGAEADADEECAAAAAASLGVRFVRREIGAELRRGGNVEGRARELRYGALRAMADETGCAKIATGHTRDDQAETFLLRLLRGSGARGLSAILPVRADGVIRPLLECRRGDVEAVVCSLGLDYRMDLSNQDPRFLRTHVRHRVLPLLRELNPSVVDSLARSAELQRTEGEILASWTAAQLTRMAQGGGLDIAMLRALPKGWASHVVRRWLEEVETRPRQLTAVHVEGVVDLAFSAQGGGQLTLPDGLRIRRRGNQLVVGATPQAAPAAESRLLKPGEELRLPGGWRLEAALGDREPLPVDLWSAVCACPAGEPTELAVRVARHGERVQPLGMRGRKKLSDLFVDHKVPREERATYPVIDHAGSIVWVPGVVRAEALRVETGTRRTLRLRARRDR